MVRHQMTKEGIRKPVWRAFQALHQAGDNLLNVNVSEPGGTVTAFATTHADGSKSGVEGLQVFVTNFSPSMQLLCPTLGYPTLAA